MSTQTTDESFREIQLNGKQLVFLFMAATVVSVVIFLCGVLVGRGVRSDQVPAQEVTAAEIAADRSASPAPAASPSTPPAPLAGDPPAPADELTYAERLQKDTSPKETLKPAPDPPSRSARVPPRNEPPAASRSEPPEAARPAQGPIPPARSGAPRTPPSVTPGNTPVATADPTGPGFAVQVAAYADRRDADTLARQLMAKGYPAFVMDPVKGGPKALYRVRVGKYTSLKDAQTVSSRLETTEQFNPWIAR